MKSDSANKLVKVSSVVQQIFGDDLHKTSMTEGKSRPRR
jgi:hypothetical protein